MKNCVAQGLRFHHGLAMDLNHDLVDAVVIGAGLSGLTAAYELRKTGLSVRIFEKETAIGESWLARHPQLSLNTHRSVSHMPDLSYDKGTPAFPKRDAVASHLRNFAAVQQISVEHSVHVDVVLRDGNYFRLETSKGDVRCRDVVVAVGRDGEPKWPVVPGIESYKGRALHAAQFGDARQYVGKRVLIIGAGNSGFDIANHLAKMDMAACWLSVRTGSAILPKRLCRIAIHRLSPLMQMLPTGLVDKGIAFAQWLAFGDLRKMGFPSPKRGAASRLADDHVAIPVDDGAIGAVRRGKIAIVPQVIDFNDGLSRHVDGSMTNPDVIIFATGYESSHFSVLRDLVGLDGQPPTPEGLQMPGIWFVGMTPGLVSHFHTARRESQSIATAICGRNQKLSVRIP